MNGLPLEYFIKNIGIVLESTADKFAEVAKLTSATRKSDAYAGIIGELSGELAFLHDVMELEVKARNRKKFYQFWK